MDFFGLKKNTSSGISGTPVSPSRSQSRSSSRSWSPSLLTSQSETVDDDSEVTFTELLDGPVSHGEDKRLDGEHVDDPQPDTLPDTLPMEDNEPVATDCPEILPELLDVKMEEEDDVEGSGEQDSQSQEEKVEVSKAEPTYYSNMSRAQEERMAESIARRVVAIQNEAKERKESK